MSARLTTALLVSALGLGACASEAPEPRPAHAPAAAQAGSSCDGTYRVTNRSTRYISRIHIRDAALTNWGPDQLGQNVVGPGQTSTLRAYTPGVYDMRVLWANGQAVERRRINICTGTQVTIGNFEISVP